MDLARAAVEHSLAIGQAYRENMALRHGLERPEHIRLADTPPPRERQAAPPAAPQSVVPVAQAIPLPPERPGWSPWAVGAAAGLGGLVSAASGWLLATGRHDPPQPPRPSAQAEIVIERPADRDDLLGYLQERGAHLPPQRRPSP